MPVSTSVHISHCLAMIIQLNPRSVLDVGCGFGVWGFLCRMYLDVMNERVQPEDWQVRIDGVELFEPYIQAHQRALYTSVRIGDIRELAPALDEYELIIVGDVIEHLEKGDGERVLELLYEKASRALLVNIPLGAGWEHPERHGNPGELHRSQWSPDDFSLYPSVMQVFDLPCGKYGTFFCLKEGTGKHTVAGLLLAAERANARNDLAGARRLLERARWVDPANSEALFFLADVCIRSGAADEAVGFLAEAAEASPANHQARLLLAKLLVSLGRRAEARDQLHRLLAVGNLPAPTEGESLRLLERL